MRVADNITYYSQCTWPKWVVPQQIVLNRLSVSGWSPFGCEGFHTNLNIQVHFLLILSNFSLQLILSVTAHSDKASVSNPAS